jgi:NAD(P)H dehydrogenase (quinone)
MTFQRFYPRGFLVGMVYGVLAFVLICLWEKDLSSEQLPKPLVIDQVVMPENPPSQAVESSHPQPGPLVLVVYYSRSGNTEKMAQAVAEGAKEVGQVRVLVRKVTEVTAEELAAADAIALGCPTYFANIPGEMKERLDLWNWKWRVDFTDKIGGAFATGGGQMGGKEHTMVSLLLFMLANRMIVAGPLFEDETGEDIWGEPGAGAMTGPLDPGISAGELDSARRLGHRLATLAKRFKQARR